MRSKNHAKNILNANDSYFTMNDNYLPNANGLHLTLNENHLHIANQILIRMICICIANENHLQKLFEKFSHDFEVKHCEIFYWDREPRNLFWDSKPLDISYSLWYTLGQ